MQKPEEDEKKWQEKTTLSHTQTHILCIVSITVGIIWYCCFIAPFASGIYRKMKWLDEKNNNHNNEKNEKHCGYLCTKKQQELCERIAFLIGLFFLDLLHIYCDWSNIITHKQYALPRGLTGTSCYMTWLDSFIVTLFSTIFFSFSHLLVGQKV